MWRKIAFGGGTTIGAICMAFVMMQAGSGCVIDDFADGGDEFVNGCARDAAVERGELAIDTDGAPFCAIFSPNSLFNIRRGTVPTCRVRGGRSDGVTGVLDSTSWIEVNTHHEGKLVTDNESLWVPTDGGDSVIPFYCDEDPGMAGAIFVKQ